MHDPHHTDMIEVTDISYAVRAKDILNGVSFNVTRGNYFALLGENGSGKSTLIDIILGDLAPSSGNITLFEQKNSYNNVGVMYDQLPLFPMLTVSENVNYFSSIHGLNYRHVRQTYFEVFDLEKIKDSFVRELSQGEKKKLGLLLAIVHKPELVVLDEPFAHIDPIVTHRLWSVMQEMAGTIFFTSHNWREAASMATHVCFIHKGRICISPASPDELLNTLPATQKIELEANQKHMAAFSDSPSFVHDNRLMLFYDDSSDLLQRINHITNNYSVRNTDLSDVYLYRVGSVKR